MNVTQQELKQIIKEELAKALKEGQPKRPWDPFGRPITTAAQRQRADRYRAARRARLAKLTEINRLLVAAKVDAVNIKAIMDQVKAL